MRPHRTSLLAFAVIGGLACESAAEPEPVEVRDPWVRTIVAPLAEVEAGARLNSAAYMVLRNVSERPDALVGAATELAESVVLHDVVAEGGATRMRVIDAIAIPPGGETALRPGGRHIMLVGLSQPVGEGDTVRLALRFASGAARQIMAPVRPSAVD